MTNKDGKIRVKISRSENSSAKEFVVRRFEPMTALDILLAVGRTQDESLAYRFSCRVGMCGTCLVRVNGAPVLACQRRIEGSEDEIRISPAAGFDVVRDLVVDMKPFWQQWARIIPFFVPKKGASQIALISHDSEERKIIDPHVNCIQCGACYTACSVSGGGNDFLGPAALNRALVLMADSRDDAKEQRQEIIDGSSGVWRCHQALACSVSCPKELDPASSIRKLRNRRFGKRKS